MVTRITAVQKAARDLEKILGQYNHALDNDFERALASAHLIWSDKTIVTAMRRMRAKLDNNDVPFVLLDIMQRPQDYGDIRLEGFWPFRHSNRAMRELKQHYERMLGTQRVYAPDMELFAQKLLVVIRKEDANAKAA